MPRDGREIDEGGYKDYSRPTMPDLSELSNAELLDRLVRTMPILSFPDDYAQVRSEILRRMAMSAIKRAEREE